MKVSAGVGSLVTDAVLGKQMENLILDRHSDLLHAQAVPNLADAFRERALRARR